MILFLVRLDHYCLLVVDKQEIHNINNLLLPSFTPCLLYSTFLEKEAETSLRQRKSPLQWPNHNSSPFIVIQSPFSPKWPYPTDGSLFSTQRPWQVINTEAYVCYIVSIQDGIQDVGTQPINQGGGSQFVGGVGALGGHEIIRTWRSSRQMVGTRTLQNLKRTNFKGTNIAFPLLIAQETLEPQSPEQISGEKQQTAQAAKPNLSK